MVIALGLGVGCGDNARSLAAPAKVLTRSDGGASRGSSPCAPETPPASSLACTGLYADLGAKTIAPGVRAYAPAVALWSDGASKQRWISLPAGERIDNTAADEWVFPVGTKVWKEFRVSGRRVETRLWQKVSATFWVNAAYAWNDDESAALRTRGGDIPWEGGTYHIPTDEECQKCHRGRPERILGFEQSLLGLTGATGLTLPQLVAEQRLTAPPAVTQLTIGDDGTGLAAPALAWLHVNCGTTCHNRNSDSTAWATGLFLRLDPRQLDGRRADDFDTLTSTIGVGAASTTWRGQPRIAPGDAAASLLYRLISRRGEGEQMPPIGSTIVDQANLPAVAAWIDALAARPRAQGAGELP